MNYIQLTIVATPEEQEILVAQLTETGTVGFEETDHCLLCYFAEDSYSFVDVNQVLSSFKFEVSVLEERNWNAVWEGNFEPVIVEDFCAIRADFHQPVHNVKLEIIITPKMSFGTGHHATTYMMIQQMRTLEFRDKNVLDFGTGTGILAILANKLGAAKITAIDVDDWSITNAAENFERNGVDGITLYKSSLLPIMNFDILLANINKNILLEYASGLQKRIKKNGYLLLSGVIADDETQICASFSNGELKLITRKQSGNWLSLLFGRESFPGRCQH